MEQRGEKKAGNLDLRKTAVRKGYLIGEQRDMERRPAPKRKDAGIEGMTGVGGVSSQGGETKN